MAHLALAFIDASEIFQGNTAMWLFLAVGAIALFGIFLPITSSFEARRKEREAFYRAETIRRLAEASGEGAKSAIEMLREDERLKEVKKLEGLKIGGVVNIGVGIGLTCLLWSLAGRDGSPYMVGLIPGLIGVGLLVYVYLLAAPVDKQ